MDSTFFQVMGFTLKEGDPAAVLDRPNAAVITENKARAYFGVQQWLQDFAYRTDLGMGLFLGAGALPSRSPFSRSAPRHSAPPASTRLSRCTMNDGPNGIPSRRCCAVARSVSPLISGA